MGNSLREKIFRIMLTWFLNIVCLGVILSYGGIPLLMVIAFTILCYIFLRNTVNNEKKIIIKSFSIQLGYLLYITVRVLINFNLSNTINSIAITEIVILSIGIIWLYLIPSVICEVYLIIYYILSSIITITNLENVLILSSQGLIISIVSIFMKVIFTIIMIREIKEYKQKVGLKLIH